MAENEEIIETPKKKGTSKLLIIGLPLFIIQLVVVYFITANILLSKMKAQTGSDSTSHKSEVVSEKSEENVDPSELGKFIFSIPDIVVNPANTDGKRYFMTSVGFDLGSEEEKKEIEERQEMVKDILNTTLSSKTLEQLGNPAYKDTIKIEILKKVKKALPEMKINKIYLSKYIIQ